VPRLVIDPVLVPNLLPILPFEGGEALVLEELDEESDGRVFQVRRGRVGRWGRLEGQGEQAVS
jgi:hypothetical protein